MIKTSLEMITAVAVKNLRIKLRNYQTYLYALGFPIMFTVLFYFMFGSQEMAPGWVIFDAAIAGMLIYAASFGTINAASAFAYEKHQGTLIRLDTTPVGRDKIFIGTLLSEAVFLVMQLIVMFIIGYAIMGLRWHEYNIGLLFVGFLIVFIFGLSTLGIGIIISAYAKTPDSATGLAIVYAIMIVFLSGALTPFESNIVYFFPPFWAFAIYKQVVILGQDFWTANVMTNDPYTWPPTNFLNIPIWAGFLIIVGVMLITLVIGIKLFQRKTLT